MRVLLTFLLKIIASFFMFIIIWFHLIMAIILWDKRFIEMDDGHNFIWKEPKK